MKPISFKRHRLRAEIIRHAVWLYFRFSLSFRDVEELLAVRGIEFSYETIRCWTIKFWPQIAGRLKKLRPAPSPRWHLDEVVSSIGGRSMYIWRAVDDEGEVLDLVAQPLRDGQGNRIWIWSRSVSAKRCRNVFVRLDGALRWRAFPTASAR